jgi:hypothetical protein
VITEATNDLTTPNDLPRFHGNAVALQMSVVNERAVIHRDTSQRHNFEPPMCCGTRLRVGRWELTVLFTRCDQLAAKQ